MLIKIAEKKSSLQSTPSWTTIALIPAPVQMGMNPTLPGIPLTPTDGIRDEPEHDFYQASTWFQIFLFLPIIVIIEFSVYNFFVAARGESIFESAYLGLLIVFVFSIGSAVFYILLALLLEHHKENMPASPFSSVFASWMRAVLIVSLIFLITMGSVITVSIF
jgi:hypothetical protein